MFVKLSLWSDLDCMLAGDHLLGPAQALQAGPCCAPDRLLSSKDGGEPMIR